MVDYGPGDEIVFIGPNCENYKQNTIYMCVDVGPTTYKRAWLYVCLVCGTRMEEAIGVWTPASDLEVCSCQFRKKLDFKKLCNVDETIKMKEDA